MNVINVTRAMDFNLPKIPSSQNNLILEDEYEEYIIEEFIVEEIIEEIESHKQLTNDGNLDVRIVPEFIDANLKKNGGVNKETDITTHIKTEPPDDSNSKNSSLNEDMNPNCIYIKSEPLDETDLNCNIKSEPQDDDSHVPTSCLQKNVEVILSIKSEPLDDVASLNDPNERLVYDSNTPNLIYLQENFRATGDVKLEPDTNNKEATTITTDTVTTTRYNLRKTKKQRSKKQTINNNQKQDKSGKIKRPAKWLISALIYCPNCNEERNKKRRETDRNCSNCSIPYYYKCGICNSVQKTIQGLARHFKYSCNDNPIFFQCKFCEHATTNPRGYILHMEEVHGEVPPNRCYRCQKCGRSYVDLSYRDAHQKKCTLNPIVQCDLCGYRSRYRKHFKGHYSRYHPGYRNPAMYCYYCSFFSHKKRYLINHIRDSHYPYD